MTDAAIRITQTLEFADTPLYRILDQARWAPSGDNTQPWRFRIVDAQTVEILYATSSLNLYEYKDGQPIHLSVGMMLETMRIAATREKLSCSWRYEGESEGLHRITARFNEDNSVKSDRLAPFIEQRSVDRRSYEDVSLSDVQKDLLEASLGDVLAIEWHETAAQKLAVSRLNALATDIRLSIPETYAVHRDIMEWDRPFSEDKIPAGTLPVDPLSRAVMHWAMESWHRVEFLNRYLAGTKGPQIEMDIIPGKHCAAHFFIAAKWPINGDIASLLPAGAALQRFWLTATASGLALQPSLATLIFAHYGRQKQQFTCKNSALTKARALAERLDALSPATSSLIFSGRIGYPRSYNPHSRSLRKPLEALLVH